MKSAMIFFALMIATAGVVNAQLKKNYVQGTLQGVDQKLTGYFWFDNALSDGAQRIYYKETLESRCSEITAADFDRFESTQAYREKFIVSHANASRGAAILLPRIEKGKINLFKYNYVVANQKHNLNRENHYYVQKGLVKTRITYTNFKDKMQDLIGDNAALIAKVKSNKLNYYDLREIIAQYNGNKATSGGNEISDGD